MKLLIVDDEPSIAELLSELILLADRKLGKEAIIESISTAGDLDLALRALWGLRPGDAVICDGNFPTGERMPGSFAPAQDGPFGKARANWPHVAGVAEKIGVIFMLYSGDLDMIERARARGALACGKPTDAAVLYAALREARAKWGLAA